jgi:hypothetical protein
MLPKADHAIIDPTTIFAAFPRAKTFVMAEIERLKRMAGETPRTAMPAGRTTSEQVSPICHGISKSLNVRTDVHVVTTFSPSMRCRRTGPIPGDRGHWGDDLGRGSGPVLLWVVS